VAVEPDPPAAFRVPAKEVASFVNAVQTLFKSMDATLQFPKRADEAPGASASGTVNAGEITAQLEKDFRGVACPMNYVKTKMALNHLLVGQVLSALLDAVGAEKVPQSVAGDGHEIISITPEGSDYRMLIRKGGKS
jgi:sulfite reductase (ferredoxin)